MVQVPSDLSDMKRAFNSHSLSSRTVDIPRRAKLMALCYAAECGLKTILMDMLGVNSPMDLQRIFRDRYERPDLHDLELLCVEASVLPADVGLSPGSFTVAGIGFEAYKVHEAARYGVKLPDAYLTDVENWLTKIASVVSQRI